MTPPTEAVTPPSPEPEPTKPEVDVLPDDEEVLDRRLGFILFRKGKFYSVKNSQGVLIAPLTTREEAEQLFRGMSRKF